MGQFRQYAVVRITNLLRDAAHYNGWGVNQRSPAVGDIGTIVDILHAPGCAESYVVESSGANGVSVWLGDFLADELESVA
jgi:hypothetical protein